MTNQTIYQSESPVPKKKIFDIPVPEQAHMLAELRAVRYGYFLSLHILLLLAAGKTPTEIATCLFCSRSSVYRAQAAYEQGEFSVHWQQPAVMAEVAPKRGSWQSSLLCLIKKSPRLSGWCRTRWSSGDAFITTEDQTRHCTVAGDYPAHASSVWVWVQTGAPHRTG